jgi:hypothetical protein
MRMSIAVALPRNLTHTISNLYLLIMSLLRRKISDFSLLYASYDTRFHLDLLMVFGCTASLGTFFILRFSAFTFNLSKHSGFDAPMHPNIPQKRHGSFINRPLFLELIRMKCTLKNKKIAIFGDPCF